MVGCGGKLIFVIKLDEAEIVKSRKLERFTMTLMNNALGQFNENDLDTFSVQSENHIWWITAFEVHKESHEVLK